MQWLVYFCIHDQMCTSVCACGLTACVYRELHRNEDGKRSFCVQGLRRACKGLCGDWEGGLNPATEQVGGQHGRVWVFCMGMLRGCERCCPYISLHMHTHLTHTNTQRYIYVNASADCLEPCYMRVRLYSGMAAKLFCAV